MNILTITQAHIGHNKNSRTATSARIRSKNEDYSIRVNSSGPNNETLDTSRITISFPDGHTWTGDIRDLREKFNFDI